MNVGLQLFDSPVYVVKYPLLMQKSPTCTYTHKPKIVVVGSAIVKTA